MELLRLQKDAASEAGKSAAQAEIKRSKLLQASGRRKESNLQEGETAAETRLGSNIPSFQVADLSEEQTLKNSSLCYLALHII